MIQVGVGVIATLALLGFIALIVLFLLFCAKKLFGLQSIDNLIRWLKPRSYLIAFILSLTATLASLFLSEVLKFQPCVLCWYQRIAMYPQPLLYYIALMRNERILKYYLIPLNIIGGIVSMYHYSLHVLPRTMIPLLPCSKVYAGVPCDKGYDFFYGFMTFPFMAAVVFSLLLVMLFISDAKNRKRSS